MVTDLKNDRIAESEKDTDFLMKGFLHDINNLFTCILCNIGAARVCDNRDELSNWLNSIRNATFNAMELTSLMMRMIILGHTMEKEACNVESIIAKTTGIFKGESNITMVSSLTQPCVILANETAIVSVLLNILMNAAEKSAHDVENITIGCDIVERSLQKGVPEECRCADISIETDNGDIDEMSIERLFENINDISGNDRGMVLETVRRIVENHRGTISIASKAGRGSRISLLFPLMERKA